MVLLVLPHVLDITPKLYSDCGGFYIFRAYINAKVTKEQLDNLNSKQNNEEELF